MSGEHQPDEGELTTARGVRIGYLPQDILELPQGTLVDSVRSGARASDPGIDDEQFEERYPRHRAEALLAGLGFAERTFGEPVATLSGGWKMRAALAALLLADPDLLLLDEPTNHLDVPSLAWFEDFLRRSKRALVLISHDRAFLNAQIGRVISLEVEGLRTYPGDYDSYRAQREAEEADLELRAARQAAEHAETMKFVERFRYKASKATQVQSRLKQLAKVETIQTREARKTVRFRFPEVARAGRDVLSLDGVAKAFGANVVHRAVTGRVVRGDKIAIVGVNGAGKTTLLKMIAEELAPDAGTITRGANVTAAYFAQHHTELLDPKKTILDTIWDMVPHMAQAHVRATLGTFLFSGDDVEKVIGVLSGGERARVALARLLVVPANLLLMDEPTNHLDLASAEHLAEALAGYGGTVVFVSHDRGFVNRLATKVWDVEAGGVTEWAGNLDDYLEHLRAIGRLPGGPKAASGGGERGGKTESDKERRQREARERDARNAALKPLTAEVKKQEGLIATLEAEKTALAPQMEVPGFYEDFDKARPLIARLEEIERKLAAAYAAWEAAQVALDAATTASSR